MSVWSSYCYQFGHTFVRSSGFVSGTLNLVFVLFVCLEQDCDDRVPTRVGSGASLFTPVIKLRKSGIFSEFCGPKVISNPKTAFQFLVAACSVAHVEDSAAPALRRLFVVLPVPFLLQLFGMYGAISSLVVLSDPVTGGSRGVGLVRYHTVEDGTRGITCLLCYRSRPLCSATC